MASVPNVRDVESGSKWAWFEGSDLDEMISLDTETFPIAPWCAAPKVVCVSAAGAEKEYLFRENPSDLLISPIVLHNAAYDMCCVAATWPETLPAIVEAYEENRIEDTMLIQKLQALRAKL